MIKNTSGLAVQPCRLHERFYYHARLLYYILRQKARGFFDAGAGAPAPPFFLSASPEGFCGGGGPSTSRCRRSALHPGEIYAGLAAPAPPDAGAPPCTRGSFLRDGSPSPQRCEGFPLCTPQSGRSAPRPGLLSRVEKVGKDTPGTSWFLDLRHKGEDPLGFLRLVP